ncbi:replication-associated recombination protein A [Patescibacteria group bacterium]|nr:replication-associated recombination protein A [Patescibacteria group bacterium]MBU1034459.1 replication-associated recombination protein A [Patescibacteria group bacterium]MBU1629907.1 replication-associated recombination protein A [Patescibacteria group bacterium]MBU1907825.1 replication-associated recombination protein A [Patescibacteria group bacterium]
MKTLFDSGAEKRRRKYAPLADRMRPQSFDEVVGQLSLAGRGAVLRSLIEQGDTPSMVFWGPPGCGKTTIAKVIAATAGAEFVELSAVTSGLQEVRQVIKEAEVRLDFHDRRTILFVDEIHRFNKSQQDAFLPWVENGTIILIGATTENPSFEVNAALLSRCRVFVLKKLEADDIRAVIRRVLSDDERGYGKRALKMPDAVFEELVVLSDGDARIALNALELVVQSGNLTVESLRSALQRTHLLYDKSGEEHYNIISAMHKSLRGSDADAALYWLGRMLEAGEDPLYVARRLVRFASEDIGLADPNALVQAVSGYQAAHFIGMPECNVILAQVTAYLAEAPKSNALYTAYSAVRDDVRRLPNEPVPLHLRNAPTDLMKDLGYGKGYKYNPDYTGPVEQDYLPEKLKGRRYLD